MGKKVICEHTWSKTNRLESSLNLEAILDRCLGRQPSTLTTTENPNVVDFKQESQPLLVNQFVLDDEGTTESNLVGFLVKENSTLKEKEMMFAHRRGHYTCCHALYRSVKLPQCREVARHNPRGTIVVSHLLAIQIAL